MLKLTKATQDDCKDIYNWRNDEETRKVSFNSGIIPYEKHKEWFARMLVDPERCIYIATEESGKKIGMIRLDKKSEDVVEISINVAPGMRGMGVGLKMIEATCGKLAFNFFFARAKRNNLASMKVFKKAGFFELFTYRDLDLGNIVVLGKISKGI